MKPIVEILPRERENMANAMILFGLGHQLYLYPFNLKDDPIYLDLVKEIKWVFEVDRFNLKDIIPNTRGKTKVEVDAYMESAHKDLKVYFNEKKEEYLKKYTKNELILFMKCILTHIYPIYQPNKSMFNSIATLIPRITDERTPEYIELLDSCILLITAKTHPHCKNYEKKAKKTKELLEEFMYIHQLKIKYNDILNEWKWETAERFAYAYIGNN